MINVEINGIKVAVEPGTTILEAANSAGITIPRLCYVKGIHEQSSCRVCVVEIEGMPGMKNSCAVKVAEGMKVTTNSPDVVNSVKENLKLTAANHVFECWICPREHNCELLDLMREYDVENTYGESARFSKPQRVINDRSPAIVLDSGKCTLCGRCVSACDKLSATHTLDFNLRGSHTLIGPALLNSMDDSGCLYCGKCIQNCPVGAIKEKDDLQKVKEALNNPKKKVIVQAAPAVRAALGEEFGMPIGTNVEGKMWAALRDLGFDEVADTNFAADLTIMEEGAEFIHRVKNGGVLPMFTSCSPGWIRYIEAYEPDFLENLSTAKSPHQMLGAIAKHHYAEKLGFNKEDVVTVSVMPCIAKKSESARPELSHEGLQDVDIVITTRELARLIKQKRIDFVNLEDHTPSGDMAQFTGAGVIFGATGGVMEAALRTVVEVLEETELPKVEFEMVRGNKGIKEATLNVAGMDVNIAIVHGGRNIKEFFKMLKTNDKQYHFVEFMGCEGGCINGGGQPIITPQVMETCDYKTLRQMALYNEDTASTLRKSHLNPVIQDLYKEFLGEPGSHIAHELLHTTYSAKPIYSNFEGNTLIIKE